MKKMKKTSIIAIGAFVVCGLLMSSGALAGNGNDLPSGPHYNLNIIGVEDKRNVGESMGHTIFVDLDGHTKILMTQATDGVFQVTDRNGLRGPAEFEIASGVYDVYARALGKPNGKVNISAYYGDDIYLGSVPLDRDTGKPQTKSLNKLFYVNGDWILNIEEYEGYYWDYNNDKLKLLQVRFYLRPE